MLKYSTRLLSFANNITKNQIWLCASNDFYRSQIFKPILLSSLNLYTLRDKNLCVPLSSGKTLDTKANAFKKTTQENDTASNEEKDQQKQKDAAWRTMKYTLIAFGFSFTCLGTYLIYELGRPKQDEDGSYIVDEYSNFPTYKQYILRTVRELNYYKKMIREPSREKLLPDPLTYPYYQPPFTLVLELTDVLVHPEWTYMTGWRFKKRPGINHFLESVSGIYEVVVFTAEHGMTVFPIIEALDPNNIISYKLVRDSTHFVDGHHVKNLSRLNRDLRKVIVVDWNGESLKFQPENMLYIPRWSGNDDDTTLIDLAAFLQTIATSDVDDVREVLRHYSQFDNPLKAFREKQRYVMEQEEASKRAVGQKEVPIVKRWAPTLLRKNI